MLLTMTNGKKNILSWDPAQSLFFSLSTGKRKVSRRSCYPSCEMHSDIFYSILLYSIPGNSILFIQCWSWPTKLISWPIYGSHPTVWRTLLQLTLKGMRAEARKWDNALSQRTVGALFPVLIKVLVQRGRVAIYKIEKGNWKREDKNVLVRWRGNLKLQLGWMEENVLLIS